MLLPVEPRTTLPPMPSLIFRPAPIVVGLLLALAGSACKGAPSSPTPPGPPPPTTPTLTGIAPASGNLATTVAVTLTGTNFVAGNTTIAVSGTGVTVANLAVTSAVAVTADLVIDGLAAALGNRTITVTTAAGTSGPVSFAVAASARFLDLGQVVRDTQTNLIWEKKTNTGGLHAVNNMYTWCQATGNRTAGTVCASNTASWIGDVNAANFAGFGDWRVPTRTELESIVNPALGPPRIDPIFGPTAAGGYWSATALEGNPGRAWSVGFVSGGAGDFPKEFTIRVRAVRSGP